MTEKRFTLSKDTEWWFVNDNTIQTNEFGYREDLTGEDAYRGLQQTLTEKETVEIMNELYEENQLIKKHIRELYKFVKIDVDNEIEVYPKVLLEYIGNILKIIGDLE